MFFDVDKEIDDKRYILLMLALQSSDSAVTVAQFMAFASETLGADIEKDDLISLHYQGLIYLIAPRDDVDTLWDTRGELTGDETLGITRVGLAVLINGAPRRLESVIANNDLPEGTLACLVPHGGQSRAVCRTGVSARKRKVGTRTRPEH